jgi:hypothetical protein
MKSCEPKHGPILLRGRVVLGIKPEGTSHLVCWLPRLLVCCTSFCGSKIFCLAEGLLSVFSVWCLGVPRPKSLFLTVWKSARRWLWSSKAEMMVTLSHLSSVQPSITALSLSCGESHSFSQGKWRCTWSRYSALCWYDYEISLVLGWESISTLFLVRWQSRCDSQFISSTRPDHTYF